MTTNNSNRNAWTKSTGFIRLAFVLLQLALLPVAAWQERATALTEDGRGSVEAENASEAGGRMQQSARDEHQEPVRLPSARV